MSSKISPMSVITPHSSDPWFSVTVSTAVFQSLSNVCQYLTRYLLLVLCQYVHCCLLKSLQCLSLPHIVPTLGSLSLFPQLSSIVCPMSVSTFNCKVHWFCFTVSTDIFYSTSTVFQYITLYRLLVLCHYVHSCLLHSSTICRYVTYCRPWFCVTLSTVLFKSLSTVCQNLTLHSLSTVCQ